MSDPKRQRVDTAANPTSSPTSVTEAKTSIRDVSVPLVLPVVQTSNQVFAAHNRLCCLPQRILTHVIIEFLSIKALCCFRASDRWLYHTVQQFIERDRDHLGNWIHLLRMACHFESIGCMMNPLQPNLQEMAKQVARELFFYAKGSATDWPLQFQRAKQRFLDQWKDDPERQIVSVAWSRLPCRNIIVLCQADAVMPDDHRRVFQEEMAACDRLLLEQSRYRVLHATPTSFGGPVVSEMVVLERNEFEEARTSSVAVVKKHWDEL